MPRFSVVTANGIVEGDVIEKQEIALMKGIAQRTADVYETREPPKETLYPSRPFNPSEERIHEVLGSVDKIIRIPKPMVDNSTESWMVDFLRKRRLQSKSA